MLNLLTVVVRGVVFSLPRYLLTQKTERRLSKHETLGFPDQAETLASIDIAHLVSLGIQAVILDLDNTIVSEDDRYVSPYAEEWILQAKDLGLKFFILSNGKRRGRVQYWSRYLDIPAINPAKKPFPDAFRRAMKYMNVTPEQVVVIGDSRHTDVLGAWVVGCLSIQVASLPHPPRWWERLLGKYVQTPYPSAQKLWDFKQYHHYGNS
jgi:hypothetical protein